jgi:hypothetical protein
MIATGSATTATATRTAAEVRDLITSIGVTLESVAADAAHRPALVALIDDLTRELTRAEARETGLVDGRPAAPAPEAGASRYYVQAGRRVRVAVLAVRGDLAAVEDLASGERFGNVPVERLTF